MALDRQRRREGERVGRLPFVFRVNVCAVVKQVLHHGDAVVAGGKVQRRGVAALQVPAVHILGRAQLLLRERGRETKRR